MNPIGQDKLKPLLKIEVDKIIQKSLISGDEVTETEFNKIEKMARIIEIRDLFSPPHKRWPLLTMLGVILLIVSMLMYFRLEKTEIELDLTVSEFQFKSSEKSEQIFTEGFNVLKIDIKGLSKLQLPRSGKQLSAEIRNNNIRIVPLKENGRQGKVTLATLVLPPKTSVTVKFTGNPDDYLFIFKGAPIDLKITAWGPIEVRPLNSSRRKFHYKTPRSLNIIHAANEIHLNVIFRDTSKHKFCQKIDVKSLSFSSIEHHSDFKRTLFRQISTISKGTLFYKALKGEKVSLRQGEPIQFQKAEGLIREFKLSPEQISLKFHGKVSGMCTGTEENPIDLMPTWLEYLRANHILALIWGTTISLFGLIVGILRWLRIIY